MDVTFFRERRGGPELALENAVVAWIGAHFRQANSSRLWAGGSVPVGAGMPDILVATYRPQLFDCSSLDTCSLQVLAYIRSVRRARLETISQRIHQPAVRVARSIERLLEMHALAREANCLVVTSAWQSILPEIVAIEAKVSNWKRGLAQARRNLLFAHKSFVALPAKTAKRLKADPQFSERGIGVLGIDATNAVSILRKGRRATPSVWTYYYQIAAYIVRSC